MIGKLDGYSVVSGGGISLLVHDGDQITRSLLARCEVLARERDALAAENKRLRELEVARFRTLRRDVRQIKRRLEAKEP